MMKKKQLKILMIDDRFPDPSDGMGFPRMFALCSLAASLKHQIYFFSREETGSKSLKDKLRRMGIKIILQAKLRTFVLKHRDLIDIVWISRPNNCRDFSKPMRLLFPRSIQIYDAEAVYSWRRILKNEVEGRPLPSSERQKILQDEVNLSRNGDLTIVVSEKEKAIFSQAIPLKRLRVWSHCLKIYSPKTPFDKRKDLLFVGGFPKRRSPNEDALNYFLTQTFPHVADTLGCRLEIAGKNLPEWFSPERRDEVQALGFVQDLIPLYERSRIFIVPHLYSAGIPLKLLEAMSYGIPSVVSAHIADQCGFHDESCVLIGRDPGEFAQKIIKLYREEALWKTIQRRGLEYVAKNHARKLMEKKLEDILSSARKLKAN
jgi:O-antigen biosynthesis protein